MAGFWYKVCKKMFLIWCIWSCFFAGCEWIRMRIPKTLYLYEGEAAEVLSGTQKKIDPEALYLDFSGDIEISQTSESRFQAVCNLFGVIPMKTMEVEIISDQEVIPGGIPVGIYVQTEGVFVVGTGQIETDRGTVESPAKNILKTGDYITSVQGTEISGKKGLIEDLARFQGEELILGIRRNQEDLEVAIRPQISENGAKIGTWVRDDTQGVGTLTYVMADGSFGALGHGISDADSELLVEVSEGKLYDCEIFEITKGQKGAPGKISGKIVYSKSNLYGEVTGNLSGGIYGKGNAHLMESVVSKPLPIALKQEVQEGKATILSSVSGELKEYEIEIEKAYRGDNDVNKGMILTVTDEELLELTGGIIQGMGVIDNRDNMKKPVNTGFSAVTLKTTQQSVSDQHRHIRDRCSTMIAAHQTCDKYLREAHQL